MMSLYEAVAAEYAAFDALRDRINAGISPQDPKVPVLKLVQEHRRAVERRVLIDVRDRVMERIPS